MDLRLSAFQSTMQVRHRFQRWLLLCWTLGGGMCRSSVHQAPAAQSDWGLCPNDDPNANLNCKPGRNPKPSLSIACKPGARRVDWTLVGRYACLRYWCSIGIGRGDVGRPQLELERNLRSRFARFSNSAVEFGCLPPVVQGKAGHPRISPGATMVPKGPAALPEPEPV